MAFKKFFSDQAEITSAWRSPSDLAIKRFKEEGVTLAIFLKFNRKYLFGKLTSLYQSHDALLLSHSGLTYVEVTCSVDGHLQAKINQHLEEHGHAPLTIEDPKTFKGNKSFKSVVNPDALDVHVTIERDFEQFVSSVEKKNQKGYASNFLLLINLSHQCGFEELPQLFEKIDNWKGSQTFNFKEVWVIEPWEGLARRIH